SRGSGFGAPVVVRLLMASSSARDRCRNWSTSPARSGQNLRLLSRARRHGTDERRIPALHGGDPAVIVENVQGPRIEQEVLPGAGGQLEPARDEHPQHVPVGEQG